ncbi:MAG: serine hydrolase [Saprospiraceae bacterium]|nr:serine hydrolase [Saprospiraceae bacterium]
MEISKLHKAQWYILPLLFWIFIQSTLHSQLNEVDHDWIQKQLAEMSLDEKIGQLFMIRAYGRNDSAHIQAVVDLITNYKVGGLCFFQGDPATQAQLTNLYQSLSKIPLLVSMDAEWGLGMRLKKDGFHFPKQLTMGALTDDELIYKMGREQAVHLKRLGVHLNFAPVLDINNNPNNPVINERSFGDDKIKVSQKSYSFMKGLQDGGVLACAKHFPGHGDTDVDSHYDLPVIKHDRARLDSFELFPFKILGQTELASVMIAHLLIPELDDHKPASLSKFVIQKLLRKDLAYDGLVITDALEMKAVSKNYTNGNLELEALKAGNDILLLSENIPAAIEAIKKALEDHEIKMSDLNKTVYRILMAKSKAGLVHYQEIKLERILEEINTAGAFQIRDKIFRQAITLVKDKKHKVPIRKLPKNSTVIAFGTKTENQFFVRLRSYFVSDEYFLDYQDSLDSKILESVDRSDVVIVSLHKLNYRSKEQYGLTLNAIEQLKQISKDKQVIVVVFGTPYVIHYLDFIPSILLAYEDHAQIHDVAAQILLGTDPISGVLPLAVSEEYPNGTGIFRPSLLRLGYAKPESMGLDSKVLAQIDSISYKMILDRATPGAQILVAKNRKIIFEKSFGTTDYLTNHPTQNETVYDLASLTKIIGSAPALMHLVDQYGLNTDWSLAQIFEDAKNTEIGALQFKDILLHQAGLPGWIPFFKQTLIGPDTLNLLDPYYYKKTSDSLFLIEVAENLFIRNDILDTIYQGILDIIPSNQKKYVYSDLGFYLVPKIFKNWTGHQFESWLEKDFYPSLGLHSTLFNPMYKTFPENLMAPSEDDHSFRQQVLLGYVHDMGAALMGGVSGHAGLFSQTRDLAIIMQCYLNLGQYGGLEYFTANTMRNFTARDEDLARRSLCFDLKQTTNAEQGYVSLMASDNIFGHQGFTGTCAWADPKHELIYIFLSNRTYPNSKVNLLHKNRYRMKIQDLIYKAMIAS